MAFHIHRRSRRRAALPFAAPPAPVAPRHRSTLPALSPRKERAARFRWPRLPRGRAPPKTGAGRGRVAPGPPCPPAPLPMAAPAAGLLPPLRSFCCSPDGFFPSALLEARAICRLCSQKHCPPFLYVWRGTSRPRNHSRARRAPPSLLPRAAALAQAQLVKLFFCCDPPPPRPFLAALSRSRPVFSNAMASFLCPLHHRMHTTPARASSNLLLLPACLCYPPLQLGATSHIHTHKHTPADPTTHAPASHHIYSDSAAARRVPCPALPCPPKPAARCRAARAKKASDVLPFAIPALTITAARRPPTAVLVPLSPLCIPPPIHPVCGRPHQLPEPPATFLRCDSPLRCCFPLLTLPPIAADDLLPPPFCSTPCLIIRCVSASLPQGFNGWDGAGPTQQPFDRYITVKK